MTPPSERHKLCAVAITYFPDPSFIERFSLLLTSVDLLVVVDNQSSPDSKNILKQLQSHSSKVHLIHNDSNGGIARALNQGITKAISLGMTLIATFDQDSKISGQYVNSMKRLQLTHGNHIYGCNYWNSHKEKYLTKPTLPENQTAIARKTLITSGMMFPTSLYQHIGEFREDYFIDSVDHEICLRARSMGYQVLLNSEVLMDHQIGKSSNKQSASFRKLLYSHPPIRMYYKGRNTVLTIKSYMTKEPLWCLKSMGGLVLDFIGILSNDENRLSKFRHYSQGLKHGLLGKSGQYITPDKNET